MLKYIGLRQSGIPTIAEILYFDVIAVVSPPRSGEEADSLTHYFEAKGLSVPNRLLEPADNAQRLLFRQLQDKGVVSDIPSLLTSQPARVAYETSRNHANRIADEILEIVYAEEFKTGIGPTITNEGKSEVAPLVRRFEDIFMHPVRQMLQANTNYHVASVVPDMLNRSLDTTGEPVLEVVINRFPTPALDTSIEAALEFRSNEDAMRALRRLRKWMADVAKKKLTPAEIETDLQDAIDQYTEYMKLHKLKFQHSAFQSLVSISLEVLEHLAKVKFRSALEAVLSFNSRRLALTEAEIKAPGREAAYIVQSTEHIS